MKTESLKTHILITWELENYHIFKPTKCTTLMAVFLPQCSIPSCFNNSLYLPGDQILDFGEEHYPIFVRYKSLAGQQSWVFTVTFLFHDAILIAAASDLVLSCWNMPSLTWKSCLDRSICCSKTCIYFSALVPVQMCKKSKGTQTCPYCQRCSVSLSSLAQRFPCFPKSFLVFFLR